MEVPQIQFVDSVEGTPVWQERQVPWRYSLVEVPQFLRERLHSTVSAAHSLLTGVRAESYGQIVDVPTPQIQVRVSERVVGQIVVLAVHQTCECRPCPPSRTVFC